MFFFLKNESKRKREEEKKKRKNFKYHNIQLDHKKDKDNKNALLEEDQTLKPCDNEDMFQEASWGVHFGQSISCCKNIASNFCQTKQSQDFQFDEKKLLLQEASTRHTRHTEPSRSLLLLFLFRVHCHKRHREIEIFPGAEVGRVYVVVFFFPTTS